MSNTNDSLPAQPGQEEERLDSVPHIARWAGLLNIAKKPKRFERKEGHREQVTILFHIYKHHSVSMKKLRSMMHLSDITLYRHMGSLKKLGFVKWKGSHKNGSYVMTDEGKNFIESNDYSKVKTA
jgi:DNA-binding MarR family transcriptional regulator